MKYLTYIFLAGLILLLVGCGESRTINHIDATAEARIDSIPTPTPQIVIQEVIKEVLVEVTVEKVVEKVPSTLLPSFEILNKHPKLDCLNKTMDVFIDIFGIWVISTKSAPENYVLHTANVLAEFIDNDLDGMPDDADVLKYLVENNYVVPVWTTSIRTDFWKQARGTYCEDNIGMAASMYYDEDQWALGGIEKTGTWDTNLEEVWHVISQGWYETYPQAFGNQDDINDTSRLREAMDIARGGKFDTVPSKYPDDAWYKYYDSTCEYHCQVSEYFYWALMSNIGALEPTLTNKCEESKHEWNICTKFDLQKIDKSVYALLNDSTFRLPKNIPLGRYIIQSTATPVPTPMTYIDRVNDQLLDLYELEENITEVPKIAWEDAQNILDENDTSIPSKVELEISVGPTTELYFEDSENAYKKAINFWSNFDQPTKYWALYYNYDDRSWAKEQILNASFLTRQTEGSVDALVEAPCTDTMCTGANSSIQSFSSVGVGVFGINQPDSWDSYRYGPVQIHEYTHAVQSSPWIGDDHPVRGGQLTSPCWLMEGQAHFAGLSLGTESYEEYTQIRYNQISGDLFSENPRVESFNDFSTQKIIEYYDNNVPYECMTNYDYTLGYSIGFLTVEVLSAFGGGDSSMHLYKLMSSGKTYAEAFELIYGYSWDESKQIIASVVSSIILEMQKEFL